MEVSRVLTTGDSSGVLRSDGSEVWCQPGSPDRTGLLPRASRLTWKFSLPSSVYTSHPQPTVGAERDGQSLSHRTAVGTSEVDSSSFEHTSFPRSKYKEGSGFVLFGLKRNHSCVNPPRVSLEGPCPS